MRIIGIAGQGADDVADVLIKTLPDYWVKAKFVRGFESQYKGRAVIVSGVNSEKGAAVVRKYGLLIHLQGRGVKVENGDLVYNNRHSLEDLEYYTKQLALSDPAIVAAPVYKLSPTIRRFDVISIPHEGAEVCPYGGVGDIVEALPGKYLKIAKIDTQGGEWVLHLASPAHDKEFIM